MLSALQLRNLIITPALNDLLLYSDEAVELLLFTCANESDGGTYIKQFNGPALGIYQMEPVTYNDIWQNWIMHKSDILLRLTHNFEASRMPDEYRLMYDLRFATAMARIHYQRVKEPLPKLYDVDGLWNYYKTYYNTAAGKANKETAVNAYQRF